jgi:hypothetical protein
VHRPSSRCPGGWAPTSPPASCTSRRRSKTARDYLKSARTVPRRCGTTAHSSLMSGCRASHDSEPRAAARPRDRPCGRPRVIKALLRRSFRCRYGCVFHELGRRPERHYLQRLIPRICYTIASCLGYRGVELVNSARGRSFRCRYGRVFHQLGRRQERHYLQRPILGTSCTIASCLDQVPPPYCAVAGSFRCRYGRVFHQLGTRPERDYLQRLIPGICYTTASCLALL